MPVKWMSSKKLLLPILILFLVFLVYREFANRPAEVTGRSAAIRPTPPIKKPVNIQMPAPAPATPQQTTPKLGQALVAEKPIDGGRPKPPKGAIPFEVHDGLVVAFGDILLGKPTRPDFPEQGFIEAPALHTWPKGEIAYSFHPQLNNPERVMRVIAYFNEFSPVRFVPYTNQTDSIVFAPSTVPLCLSYVGRIGGHQPIYLDDRCGDKEITHELMHALGFIHEHSRPDRDNYVKVNWDNIEEDKQSQFESAPLSLADPYKGRPFDYQSVMIYGPTDFAKQRGEATLESRTGALIEPARQGLSPEDLLRLQMLYAR